MARGLGMFVTTATVAVCALAAVKVSRRRHPLATKSEQATPTPRVLSKRKRPQDAGSDAAWTTGKFSHYAPPCDRSRRGPDVQLGRRTAVDKRRIYHVASTAVSFCAVQVAFPYNGERHRLWVLFDVFTEHDAATYDLDGSSYVLFHGVRIEIGVAKPSFESPDIWVQATNAPSR
jgi:hypothetical protein